MPKCEMVYTRRLLLVYEMYTVCKTCPKRAVILFLNLNLLAQITVERRTYLEMNLRSGRERVSI